ncbi:MAG: interleukin-like EMT inducer domain-containing protein [Anaerolineae bacterium]
MRRHLWILVLYLLLSLLLTWPLAAQFTTHVPGDGIDDPSLAWNLWWVKHALVDRPQNPFACTWQFWPIGINLAFYTLTVLNGLLSVPLQAVFGLIPAYNLLLLSSFVLSGFGAYLLSLDFLRDHARSHGLRVLASPHRRGLTPSPPLPLSLPAFLGGALYAFASAKLFYAALGQGNIASSQWIPFAALYMVRAARPRGTARDAALAGLFLVLQAYAELTYASFLVLFAVLVAGWGVARGQYKACHSPFVAPLLGRFLLIAGIVALGLAPILANMLPDLRAEGDFFTSGGGFSDVFSADLAGYLVPTQLHPLLGGVIRAWANGSAPRPDGSHFAVDKGQQIYLGYVALALAVWGVWQGRQRGATWFWFLSALAFFLLTLGPALRVAGYNTGIPLPFRIMEQLPFFKGNRYPSRYSVMLLLSLVPLVAAGAQRTGEWANGKSTLYDVHSTQHPARAMLLISLFTCFLLFEHLSVPLPMFDLRVPALYDRVAAEPGDFALLELPLGWRNGARVAGKQDILIMQQLWYQSRHGKRLLGGNTSRNPEYKFQYFSEDPTLARLIALTNAADLPQHAALRAALAGLPVTDADRAAARAWAALLDIRYVMVHRDKLPAAAEALIRDLLPLALIAEEGELALYRLDEPLTPPARFLLGSDEGRRVLGEGWSPPTAGPAPTAVYAQRREVRLLLPLPATEATLQLSGQALPAGQYVTLIVNGRHVGTQAWPPEPTTLAFKVPADPARPRLSDVRLRFARLAAPAALFQDNTGRTGIGVLIRSAGQETGDFAHVYIAGRDRSLNRRGYNLVAFDPVQGHVVAAAAFDTHADPNASAALARWVAALPPGLMVAGAVRDEASLNLTEEAVAALRSLGVTHDLRSHFRWGHAFLGRTGAATSTLEALDGIWPAQIQVGPALSEPGAAAVLTSIEIIP